jgi:hypothetical protein
MTEPPHETERSPLFSFHSKPQEIFAYFKRRMLWSEGSLESWFYRALEMQEIEGKRGNGPFGNYYEFGVGGRTLMAYIKALSLFCRAKRGRDFYKYHIFGFDSFKGLPEKKGFQDDSSIFWKGEFSHSVQEIEEKIHRYGVDLKQGNIHFIKGFFEDTLTSELRDNLKEFTPSIVTVDVDYYSSTKIVLEWLTPFLSSGTLFYFDDIWCFHGHPDYGELCAINEFNKIGDGQLASYPVLGKASLVYIFSRKELEYVTKRKKMKEHYQDYLSFCLQRLARALQKS